MSEKELPSKKKRRLKNYKMRKEEICSECYKKAKQDYRSHKTRQFYYRVNRVPDQNISNRYTLYIFLILNVNFNIINPQAVYTDQLYWPICII